MYHATTSICLNLLLTVCLFFSLSELYAQQDYIIIDHGRRIEGMRIKDNGPVENAHLCQVMGVLDLTDYRPEQLVGYGFGKGKDFVSKEIVVNDVRKKVFLELLTAGRFDLYYYAAKEGGRFFLEKEDESFLELQRGEESGDQEDFQQLLSVLMQDCEHIEEVVDYVNFRKFSLRKLLRLYNTCIQQPFPIARYGALLGYSGLRLYAPSKVDLELFQQLDFNLHASFTVGLFADIPIMSSYMSFHPEIQYSVHKAAYSQIVNAMKTEVELDLVMVNVPILIRYSFPYLKWRPFINAGVIYSRHIQNTHVLYQTDINAPSANRRLARNNDFLRRSFLAFSLGGGLQFQLNAKQQLFFELRASDYLFPLGTSSFNTLSGNLQDGNSFTKREINVIIGFSFL